jgi:Family of unknown function (DUF5760)
METKEELITNIKEWIKIDNEILQLQKEMKDRKIRKKTLTDALMTTMKKNEIDCFDINGGSIVYKKNKIKKPLNGKSLMAALQKYYDTKPQQAEEVTKFILENREEQVKEVIKRKIDK